MQGSTVVYQSIGPTKYRYREIALFAGKSIYENRPPANEYERKCDQLATKLYVHVILSTILVLFSYILVLIGPAYDFIVKREYVSPTGVIMPFMDPDSRLSLSINLLIQSVTAVICLINTVGLEAVNCFIVNSFTAMNELVCFNMRAFSGALQPRQFTLHQKTELRRIIMQLRDLEDYISEMNNLFYWRTLTHPIMSTWCVSLGIFSQKMVSCTELPVSFFSMS